MGMAQRVVGASRRLAPPFDRRSARRQPADGDRAVLRITREAAVLVALRADGQWFRRVGLPRCHRSPRTRARSHACRSPITSSRRTPRFTSCACRRARRCPDSRHRWPKADGRYARRPTAFARSFGLQGTRGIRFLPRLVLRIARRLAAVCARSSGTSPCGSSRSRTTRCGSTRSQSSSISIARRFGRRGTAFHTTALREFHLDVTDRAAKGRHAATLRASSERQLVGVMYGILVQRALLLLSARLRFSSSSLTVSDAPCST